MRAAIKQHASEQANTVTNVAVYLEPDLLDIVRLRRRSTEGRYDQVVGDAFGSVNDEQLASVSRSDPGVTSRTGCRPDNVAFSDSAAARHELARMDRPKAVSHRCLSRSALVAAVLRLTALRNRAGSVPRVGALRQAQFELALTVLKPARWGVSRSAY